MMYKTSVLFGLICLISLVPAAPIHQDGQEDLTGTAHDKGGLVRRQLGGLGGATGGLGGLSGATNPLGSAVSTATGLLGALGGLGGGKL